MAAYRQTTRRTTPIGVAAVQAPSGAAGAGAGSKRSRHEKEMHAAAGLSPLARRPSIVLAWAPGQVDRRKAHSRVPRYPAAAAL